MSKALEYYSEGYNCCEAIVKAVNDEKETNIPVSIATPFGTGMCTGITCGAITGAVIAMGAIKGRNDVSEKNNTRKDTIEFMKKIKEKYGTVNCVELKRKGVSCEEMVEECYNLLKEHI